MCGSSGGTQTTVSKMDPPEEAKPLIADFSKRAMEAANTPYMQYGGDRIAGWTQDQNRGFNATRRAVGNSNMDNMMGRSNLAGPMSGFYMGGSGASNPFAGLNNPYLNDSIKAAQGDTIRAYQSATAPQTDSNFARQGAFGGSAWRQAVDNNQNTLGNALARQSTDIRMQDYGQQLGLAENQANRSENAFQSERARQMAGMNSIGQLQQNDLRGAQALLGIGDAQQGMNQDQLNMAYSDWMAQKNQPLTQLDIEGNALARIMGTGGSQTTTAPTAATNRTSGALGGALAGASLFGPFGALGGAILGGL